MRPCLETLLMFILCKKKDRKTARFLEKNIEELTLVSKPHLSKRKERHFIYLISQNTD